MILVIIAICIILIIIGDYLGRKNCDYEGRCLAFLIPGIGALVLSVIVAIALIILTMDCKVMDQQIEILKENNAEIEEKIGDVVDIYCEYEDDNFDNFQSPESIFLVFPELKADTLFQTYMMTLQENKKEITDLQLKKAYESTYKWWLYFGS